MGKNSKNTAIIGAGISGLATALWLRREELNVTVFEASNEAGGSMRTESVDGYTIDFGPNSGLETSPLIAELAQAAEIEDEMMYAADAAKIRYILKDGKLQPLPTGPGDFFKSKIFTLGGKLRVFAEPFIGKAPMGVEESLAEFAGRRVGKQFADFVLDPFVSGVYAGDAEQLSVRMAFPKVSALEDKYGSLIKGMIKGAKERKKRAEKSKQDAKMFSFKNGMQSFPKAVAGKLGENVKFGSKATKISSHEGKYKVAYESDGSVKEEIFDAVITTLPAYKMAPLLRETDSKLAAICEKIVYPPVLVLFVGYDKSAIKRDLDGFGFLIPSKEKKNFLGAIWSSTIFPNRAPEEKAAFTIFVGGIRHPEILEKDESAVIDAALKEFNEVMGIKGEPELLRHKLWAKAIPQYNIGYAEYEKYFVQFEQNNPGIFLSGNFRGGISVGDCVKNSGLVAEKVKKYLESKN